MPEPYKPEGSDVTFTVPSLDDAADGPQAFRDFADSIPKELSTVLEIKIKKDDYTLALSDNSEVIMFDCSDKDHSVTVPKSVFPIGSVVVVGNTGSNRKSNVTVVAESGVTIRDVAVRKVGYGHMVALVCVEPDSWIINAGTGQDSTNTPASPVLNTVTAAKGGLALQWTPPTDDGGSKITGFLLEYSKDGTEWNLASLVEATKFGGSVTGLESDKPYQVRVKAANKWGTGNPSNVKSGTPT